MRFTAILLLAAFTLLAGCTPTKPSPKPELTVAAAANLTEAFGEIARQFEAATAIHVIHSFGATGDLTRQIENSAPFDVVAAADLRHILELDNKGFLTPDTRAVFAQGRLAMWTPPGSSLHLSTLEDLASPRVRFIAIANPAIAPYGAAAVDALRTSHLWDQVQPKVVYAESISMAKQYAATHNADASFTAYSLVLNSGGHAVLIDQKLYTPLEQAFAIVKRSPKQDLALRYRQFVLGSSGRSILQRFGYGLPQ